MALALSDSVRTESACLVKFLTQVLLAYVNSPQHLKSLDVASVYLLEARGAKLVA